MVNKSKNEIVNKVLNDKYNDSTFERIKHLDDCGNEYWYALDNCVALEFIDNSIKVVKSNYDKNAYKINYINNKILEVKI